CTVNHRFLEISLRLPDEIKALDQEVRQTIGGALRRGKVDAGLHLKNAVGGQRALELDTGLLDALLEHVEQVRARLPDAATVSPIELLRWPGVLRESAIDAKPALVAALEVLREALDELNETRRREGERIRELLLARCAAMRVQVQVVRERLPEVSQRLRERLVERISQLGAPPDT